MGGAKNCPETPRQRMIAMMYLVLTAMLALNVSTDILNGFKLVDDNLHSSLEATEIRNDNMMSGFEALVQDNPEKYQVWYDRAIELKEKADSMVNYIQDFKYQIVLLADGEKADKEVREIQNKDNLDVTANYAINQGNGKILKQKIEEYREFLVQCALEGDQEAKRAQFEQIFSTKDGKNHDGDPISWEASIFEGMPVSASITILTKIQNDVRSAQGDMITYILDKTDATDLRVNKYEAFVRPDATYIMKGGKYNARIALAAIDSTQVPEIYVNGQLLENGIYTQDALTAGAKSYSGEIKLADGTIVPFQSEYIVGDLPTPTISNTELNVMYRDYENKFSVSVPNIKTEDISISVNNGATCKKASNGLWLITPTRQDAKEVIVTVTANIEGKNVKLAEEKYRVKKTPQPSISLVSGEKRYDTGAAVPLRILLQSGLKLDASYGEDGLLDIAYDITGFTLEMPSETPKKSNSANFTPDITKSLEKNAKALAQRQSAIIVNQIKAKDKKSGKEIALTGKFIFTIAQ